MLRVAFLVLALLCSAVHARDVSVQARRDGNAVLVEAGAQLQAPVLLAWDVITGYDRYAEFVPDLHSSEVLARSGNTAIVEQKGVAGFFLFHFPLDVRMVVTEVPFESITSQAISGTFSEMTGTYRLAEDGEGLRLSYQGRLVPNFQLPPLVGLPAVRAAVEKQFTALVKEIRRRDAIRREAGQP